MRSRLEQYLAEVERHLFAELLPYWRQRGDDPPHGGFLTFFDREGRPTGEHWKNLLAHARMIYTFSSLHREGCDPDRSFLQRAGRGLEFLQAQFLDRANGGWYWTTERDGAPRDRKKLVYGHAFVIHAASEYARAAGDPAALRLAVETFARLQLSAADNLHGGWYEFFEEDWRHCPPGTGGGDRKSLDVHMHLMEALTNLWLAGGDPLHRRRTVEVIELIRTRMLHPEHGVGLSQFSPDWRPLRAIIFANVWGSDREAGESEGRPLDNTSFGHNVELGWLLGVATDAMGLDRELYHPVIRRQYEHCLAHGLDWSLGGLWCEGPAGGGPARERNKEFWQQAEGLVAMLDGYARFGEERCLEGYANLHRFVMDHVINHRVGEWLPLLGPDNRVLWDYLGHAWKINYHTVRAMLECRRRLLALLGR